MAKYQPYSRGELRRLRVAWLSRNRLLVMGLAVGAGCVVALEALSFVLVVPGTPLKWWLLGAAQASTVAALLHLVDTGFLVHERDALRQVRGAWGEENTRSELQRAKRKRLIWGWVDSIRLAAGDLDHVAVTRHGGLVVIDSKWRSQATDVVEMSKSAARVKTRAEGVARSILTSERAARHRAKINPVTVTPVVVLWGALQHDVPDGACIDGIAFVGGRNFVAWLRSLDGDRVDKAAAADIIRKLEGFRADVRQSIATR
ncbi:NERD domain-containing protein [Nocardioides sp. CN2-186]|uniref:NERD domain-containing protein n=1 Tax=Nocardioides tweenelious TaxID=3156607 RepID=UPI0032B35EB3